MGNRVVGNASAAYSDDQLVLKYGPLAKIPAPQKHPDKIKSEKKLLLERVVVLNVTKGKVKDVIEALRSDPDVEYVEPDYIVTASFTPNDPYYSYQWNFAAIQMSQAWDVSTGLGVTVAVIDSGVAYEDYLGFRKAPDLSGTVFVAGWDFVNNDAHPNDDYWHGTHVAGTIAQTTNNAIGAAGIAYNAWIMPVKVLDSAGNGYDSWVADGIVWAVDHGAKVINLSLGEPNYSQVLQDAVDYAYNHGVTVVAASGNQGSSSVNYPAACSNAIAVGAVRYDQTRVCNPDYCSNYGSALDFVAPGGDLTVDQNGDGYGDGVLQQTFANGDPTNFGYYFAEGTSMAAPHVSGLAALLYSAGYTTPDEIRQRMIDGAKDLGATGWDSSYGYGLIQSSYSLHALSAELVAPADGSTITSSPIRLEAEVTGSPPIAGPDIADFYVDGALACGIVVCVGTICHCDYVPNQAGHTYSWYATAWKSGYTPATSPTWSFTYSPPYSAPVGISGIAIVPDPSNIGQGSKIIFTVTVHNTGTVDISSVKVQVRIYKPGSTTAVSSPYKYIYTFKAGTDRAVELTYTLSSLSSYAPLGYWTYGVYLYQGSTVLDQVTNQGFTVQPAVKSGEILSVVADPDPVGAGGATAFTVTFENTGNVIWSSGRLTAKIYKPGSSTVYSTRYLTVSKIVPNVEYTYQVMWTPSSYAVLGTYTYVVTLAYGYSLVLDSSIGNMVTVEPIVKAGVITSVADAPDPVARAGTATFTVTVMNPGNFIWSSGKVTIKIYKAGSTTVYTTKYLSLKNLMPGDEYTYNVKWLVSSYATTGTYRYDVYFYYGYTVMSSELGNPSNTITVN